MLQIFAIFAVVNQFDVINSNWGLFFGGSGGTLLLGHSDATTGFDGDNDLTVGETYVLTVDLGKQTYTYSLK